MFAPHIESQIEKLKDNYYEFVKDINYLQYDCYENFKENGRQTNKTIRILNDIMGITKYLLGGLGEFLMVYDSPSSEYSSELFIVTSIKKI